MKGGVKSAFVLVTKEVAIEAHCFRILNSAAKPDFCIVLHHSLHYCSIYEVALLSGTDDLPIDHRLLQFTTTQETTIFQ